MVGSKKQDFWSKGKLLYLLNTMSDFEVQKMILTTEHAPKLSLLIAKKDQKVSDV